MNFTPLDILYIVLAFCALWVAAAVFWLVWQVGSILRNVNDTLELAQEKIARIESAITGIRSRFDHLTSSGTVLLEGLKRLIEFATQKKDQVLGASAPARRRAKAAVEEDEMQEED